MITKISYGTWFILDASSSYANDPIIEYPQVPRCSRLENNPERA